MQVQQKVLNKFGHKTKQKCTNKLLTNVKPNKKCKLLKTYLSVIGTFFKNLVFLSFKVK